MYTYTSYFHIYLPPPSGNEPFEITGSVLVISLVIYWESFFFQTGTILGHHFKDKY